MACDRCRAQKSGPTAQNAAARPSGPGKQSRGRISFEPQRGGDWLQRPISPRWGFRKGLVAIIDQARWTWLLHFGPLARESGGNRVWQRRGAFGHRRPLPGGNPQSAVRPRSSALSLPRPPIGTCATTATRQTAAGLSIASERSIEADSACMLSAGESADLVAGSGVSVHSAAIFQNSRPTRADEVDFACNGNWGF